MNKRTSFDIFKENVDNAKQTLKLLKIEELWEEFRSYRLLLQIRLMPFRNRLRERSKRTYDVVLPQTIVFSVSSLEAFLKEKHREKTGQEYKGALQRIDYIIKAFRKYVNFKDHEELLGELQKIFDKRHLIAHRAGRIDNKYCRDYKLEKTWERKKLPLDSTIVEKDLSVIEKFANFINQFL